MGYNAANKHFLTFPEQSTQRYLFNILLTGLTLLAFFIQPAGLVHAQEATPYELIDITNSWRSNYGNPPLILDGALMASAQNTADIMAAQSFCGHLGGASDRAAAAGFGGGSMVYASENIACGTNMSATDIMNGYWSDAIHMLPETVAAYTHVGAALAKDSNGFTYYVLHAAYAAGKPGSSSIGSKPPAGVATPVLNGPAPTIQYIQAVKKADPQPDGSIIHTVGYGQTLSGISDVYAVPLQRLVELNPVIGPNMVIYEKQKLLIALAPTPTPTSAFSATPEATATSMTPTPSVTPLATLTPQPTATLFMPLTTSTVAPKASTKPLLSGMGSTQLVGIIVLAASLLGLGLMVYSGFSSRKK